MNIAIIDADLIGRSRHRFPNLASMKISGYHKLKGNSVVLKTDYKNLEQFDKVYISKVFTDTPVDYKALLLHNVHIGGTGFFYDEADPLPEEIEHSMPDYNLYDDWISTQPRKGNEFEYYENYSIGYTTRKCFRGCKFCVNRNYKKVELWSPLEEFADESRKYICLLDDNVFGYPGWRDIIKNLQNTNKYFQFKQGMDERLLTKEKSIILNNCKYKGDYIFAFDNIEDKDLIKSKLDIWKAHCKKTTKFYVFCGFDRNDVWGYDFWVQDIVDVFERIKILMTYGCLPYIMRFERYEESPHRGIYINLARWCIQVQFYKKKSFREFCIVNGENSSTMKYLNMFEQQHPDIAKEYFDLKYENLNKF